MKTLKELDTEWKNKRKKLFNNNLLFIQPKVGESIDQFIGKLRDLEDGKDIHKSSRRSLNEELLNQLVYTYNIEEFRDQRDEQLYNMWKSGLLNRSPIKRKLLNDMQASTPLKNMTLKDNSK